MSGRYDTFKEGFDLAKATITDENSEIIELVGGPLDAGVILWPQDERPDEEVLTEWGSSKDGDTFRIGRWGGETNHYVRENGAWILHNEMYDDRDEGGEADDQQPRSG